MGLNNKAKRKIKKNRKFEKIKKNMHKKEFKEISIYLDESGSSGINFVDEKNPFFIQAGMILHTKNIKKLEKVYEDWENKYKQENQKEIKSDIFKSNNGFKIFNELYQEIQKYIISPTYAVLEKKFAISFTLLESLIDFDHNSLVGEELYYNAEKKNEWANQIYECIDEETLLLFNLSRSKTPSKEHFKNAKSKLCESLVNKDYVELGKILSSGDLEYSYNFFSSDQNRKKASVNVLTFQSHFLQLRKEFFKKRLSKVTIIHDQQLHYSENFLNVVKEIDDMPLHHFKVSHNESVLLGKFMDTELKFSDENENPLLKISDLICGYLRYSLERIYKNDKEFSKYAIPLFYLFWTPLLRNIKELKGEEIPDWYYDGVSKNMKIMLQKTLFDFFKQSKENNN